MREFLVLIVLGFFVLGLNSCHDKKDIQEIIVGEWEVTDFEINTQNINPELLKEAKELALTSSYVFKESGECYMKYELEELNGSWEYNADNNKIYMQFPESDFGIHVRYIISQYKKDGMEMIWKTDLKELGYTAMKLTRKQTEEEPK